MVYIKPLSYSKVVINKKERAVRSKRTLCYTRSGINHSNNIILYPIRYKKERAGRSVPKISGLSTVSIIGFSVMLSAKPLYPQGLTIIRMVSLWFWWSASLTWYLCYFALL